MEDLRDPIFKGCTRPAMKMGVPLTPLVAVVGLALLLSLWGIYIVGGLAPVVVLAVVIPVIMTMRGITRQDDQRLAQMILFAQMRSTNGSHQNWGVMSYAPVRYKKR